jgi:hypothetical protein
MLLLSLISLSRSVPRPLRDVKLIFGFFLSFCTPAGDLELSRIILQTLQLAQDNFVLDNNIFYSEMEDSSSR